MGLNFLLQATAMTFATYKYFSTITVVVQQLEFCRVLLKVKVSSLFRYVKL